MPRINEAIDMDLKIIGELKKIGWKAGDTLTCQEEHALTPNQQKIFERKSIKPDIIFYDLNQSPIAIFENKFEDEKKALAKPRALYAAILKLRFLYACSPERILFYDIEWKGLEAGEFRQVNSLMSLEEMQLKVEQSRKRDISAEKFSVCFE